MQMNAILALAFANLIAAQGNGTVADEATSTVTATSTNLITTCPPGGACHATHVAPATTACPEATHVAPVGHQKVVCYGDECWDEAPCDHCPKLRVICVEGYCYVEECETADYNRLVVCEGEKCDYAAGHKQKLVCYEEVCEIEECHGVECEEKIINHEACTGEHCPKPAPPAGPVAPPAAPPAAPVCPGPDCKAPPAPPAAPAHPAPPAPPAAPVCPGPECEVVPPAPVHPCPGPDCQVLPPKGDNSTIPVHAGAGSVVPGAGALFGLLAGFAALL
ncbi:hypothetical protein LIA77_02013 [Sarocladium implicatum]|nr:hypothetical protein LIA77_02013 [Sarocladium implicatum]